jgi:phage repressor protein C with HTH and peptisase S24 domain
MRRPGLLLGAALACVAVIAAVRRLERIAVSGHSMAPTLRDGDWLLVWREPRRAEPRNIVVARDPRDASRLIVKRVREATDSQLWLESDHPAHSDEVIGPVDWADLRGKVIVRYWPPSRVSLVR